MIEECGSVRACVCELKASLCFPQTVERRTFDISAISIWIISSGHYDKEIQIFPVIFYLAISFQAECFKPFIINHAADYHWSFAKRSISLYGEERGISVSSSTATTVEIDKARKQGKVHRWWNSHPKSSLLYNWWSLLKKPLFYAIANIAQIRHLIRLEANNEREQQLLTRMLIGECDVSSSRLTRHNANHLSPHVSTYFICEFKLQTLNSQLQRTTESVCECGCG